MITADQYKKYSKSLAQISERAQGRFESDMKKVAGESIDVQVEAAKQSLKIINAYYGDMAATVSAEWFEALGEKQAGKVYDAVLAETWPDHKIEGSVDYARRHLEDGKPEKFLSYLDGTTDKAVKQAARDTIIQSCERYEKSGVRYARVPQGPTCPFCIMLASRGFIYHSEDTAGEFEKFHSHCDCEIVPSWEKSPRVEGYDPEKMYERYLMCRDTLGEDYLKSTYVRLPFQERLEMTQGDWDRKQILAEMGTRDREWLYSGKEPKPTFVSKEWLAQTKKERRHELYTAGRLKKHGIRCDFVDDSAGLADFASGVEIKTLDGASTSSTVESHIRDTSKKKKNAKSIIFDNSKNTGMSDAELVNLLESSRRFKRGSFYILDHNQKLHKIVRRSY